MPLVDTSSHADSKTNMTQDSIRVYIRKHREQDAFLRDAFKHLITLLTNYKYTPQECVIIGRQARLVVKNRKEELVRREAEKLARRLEKKSKKNQEH